MAYRVMVRFYSGRDQTAESYVVVSDNGDPDTKLEVGQMVYLELRETDAPSCGGYPRCFGCDECRSNSPG